MTNSTSALPILPGVPAAGAAMPVAGVPVAAVVPKPPTGAPLPEWANLAFGALALIALVLGMVWMIRRGKGGPWR